MIRSGQHAEWLAYMATGPLRAEAATIRRLLARNAAAMRRAFNAMSPTIAEVNRQLKAFARAWEAAGITLRPPDPPPPGR